MWCDAITVLFFTEWMAFLEPFPYLNRIIKTPKTLSGHDFVCGPNTNIRKEITIVSILRVFSPNASTHLALAYEIVLTLLKFNRSDKKRAFPAFHCAHFWYLHYGIWFFVVFSLSLSFSHSPTLFAINVRVVVCEVCWMTSRRPLRYPYMYQYNISVFSYSVVELICRFYFPHRTFKM